jgi:hypothetical protein
MYARLNGPIKARSRQSVRANLLHNAMVEHSRVRYISLSNFVTGVQPGIRDTTGRGVRTCVRPTKIATLDPTSEQIKV